MSKQFTYSLTSIRFDENYHPSNNTRLTTNFANLARGESRQENLRNTLKMMNERFNNLANWDNPNGDRYSIELDIVSVGMDIGNSGIAFPIIEVLKTNIVDHSTKQHIQGIVGNSFSSYVRDYDFSVLLLEHNKDKQNFSIPENFGDLHGNLYKDFVSSNTFKQHFNKQPVICLSVASNKTYHRTTNTHPILGVEYTLNEISSTDKYFGKMGLRVRYFMPPNSVAPLAFYFSGDLLNDYTNLELISTISTMETFQKIYRPEIYNANTVAGEIYQPSLQNENYSLTRIYYDRVERSQLAIEQGKFTEKHFIKPYQNILSSLSPNLAI